MLIDCDTCVVRHQACDDCVVGVLLGVPEVPARDDAPREPAAPGAPLPLEFGPVERRALEVLADHGLIPHLRLVPGTVEQPAARSAGRARRRDAG